MDITEYSTLDWAAFDNLIFSYFRFNFNTIDDLANKIEMYKGKIEWLPLKEWEKMDDTDIYNKLEELGQPEGELFVITDISYIKKLGSFKLNATHLRKFIVQYFDIFHECFFNGDVLIFSLEHNLVWIFHHGGVYALAKLPHMT